MVGFGKLIPFRQGDQNKTFNTDMGRFGPVGILLQGVSGNMRLFGRGTVQNTVSRWAAKGLRHYHGQKRYEIE